MEETKDDIKRFQIINGMCAESALLLSRLSKGKPGETVTDEELTKLIGFDTSPGDGKGYSNLQTAVHACRKHFGLDWQRVPKEGVLRCLKGNETLDHVRDRGMTQIRRKSRGLRERLITVKPDELDDAKRREWRARVAALRLGEVVMGNQAEAKLIEANVTAEKVEMKRLIAALSNGNT